MGYLWRGWKYESWNHCNHWCSSYPNIARISGSYNIFHTSKVGLKDWNSCSYCLSSYEI